MNQFDPVRSPQFLQRVECFTSALYGVADNERDLSEYSINQFAMFFENAFGECVMILCTDRVERQCFLDPPQITTSLCRWDDARFVYP
jgi:hypothetical protein